MRRGVCKNILYNSAIELVKQGKVVAIDVRDHDEVRENFIKGSINIPLGRLTDEIKHVVPNLNQPILVYCSTGSRSIFACQILANQGYNKVYNLYGGCLK